MYKICLKLLIETPKRLSWGRAGDFIGNFEQNFYKLSSVSIVDFEQVYSGWVVLHQEESLSTKNYRHISVAAKRGITL